MRVVKLERRKARTSDAGWRGRVGYMAMESDSADQDAVVLVCS